MPPDVGVWTWEGLHTAPQGSRLTSPRRESKILGHPSQAFPPASSRQETQVPRQRALSWQGSLAGAGHHLRSQPLCSSQCTTPHCRHRLGLWWGQAGGGGWARLPVPASFVQEENVSPGQEVAGPRPPAGWWQGGPGTGPPGSPPASSLLSPPWPAWFPRGQARAPSPAVHPDFPRQSRRPGTHARAAVAATGPTGMMRRQPSATPKPCLHSGRQAPGPGTQGRADPVRPGSRWRSWPRECRPSHFLIYLVQTASSHRVLNP